jgi:threonine dehydrogenase-like Zn-dependent dehydrogenase
VPGHETVVRVVRAGSKVQRHKVGERYLVQTDYRWLPTASSNAAFGYNFEGALQEYVLMDERVIISPEGESMLIAVPEDLSGSAIALIEPWACVENSYVETQRQTLKEGGRLLVISDTPVDESSLRNVPGHPSFMKVTTIAHVAEAEDASFDDVIYFGSNATSVECLFPKLAAGGLLNIVQGEGNFGRPVVTPVGRIHYGGIRIVGTKTRNPESAMAQIPHTTEICPHDRINIVGAAGPMGAMHVVRALCQGVEGVKVFAGDLSDERLATLRGLAQPLAARNGLALTLYNPSKATPPGPFNYIVLMAPVAALIPPSIASADRRAIINIFAGIPADTKFAIDLDAYIEGQLYFVGTSGSLLSDMKRVLAKVVARQLDTNLSVAAVSGLDGAIDGIRAVEKNLMSGKILVYPSCRGLPLMPLGGLGAAVPLENGHWSLRSEEALLRMYGRQ